MEAPHAAPRVLRTATPTADPSSCRHSPIGTYRHSPTGRQAVQPVPTRRWSPTRRPGTLSAQDTAAQVRATAAESARQTRAVLDAIPIRATS